jgi:hypothetical protein
MTRFRKSEIAAILRKADTGILGEYGVVLQQNFVVNKRRGMFPLAHMRQRK